MKLSEVVNNPLKDAFTQALEVTIKKYEEHFDGDKADKARDALVGKFDANMNKLQITQVLTDLGVGNARDIAQTLLNQTNRLYK